MDYVNLNRNALYLRKNKVLNWAWRNYLVDDANYSELEQKAIIQLLNQVHK